MNRAAPLGATTTAPEAATGLWPARGFRALRLATAAPASAGDDAPTPADAGAVFLTADAPVREAIVGADAAVAGGGGIRPRQVATQFPTTIAISNVFTQRTACASTHAHIHSHIHIHIHIHTLTHSHVHTPGGRARRQLLIIGTSHPDPNPYPSPYHSHTRTKSDSAACIRKQAPQNAAG